MFFKKTVFVDKPSTSKKKIDDLLRKSDLKTLKTDLQYHKIHSVKAPQELLLRRVSVQACCINTSKNPLQVAPAYFVSLLQNAAAARQEGFFNASRQHLTIQEITHLAQQAQQQWRFIITPQDAKRLCLTKFIRELVQHLENTFQYSLCWQAINHFHEGQSHTHIIIHEKEILISAQQLQYFSRTLQHLANTLVTQFLGLRNAQEVSNAIQQEIHARHLTAIDQELLRRMRKGQLTLKTARKHPLAYLQRSRIMGRLAVLSDLGLAQQNTNQQWQLDTQLRYKLQQLERTDTAMQRLQYIQRTLAQPVNGLNLHTQFTVPTMEGVILAMGLQDELSGEAYLIIGDRDGILHQIDVPTNVQHVLQVGHIIRIPLAPAKHGIFQLQHRQTLSKQVTYHGRSWLDEHYNELIADERLLAIPMRLRIAAQARAQWLKQQGLQAGTRACLAVLDAQERLMLAQQVTQCTGLRFHSLGRGESWQGELLGGLDTPSLQHYVMVKSQQEFAMLAWQERQSLRKGQFMVIGINPQGKGWTKATRRYH